MKVFAAGLFTESNTFSAVPTSLADFSVQRGKDGSSADAGGSIMDLTEIWGAPAKAGGHEFLFSLMAFAQPSGTTVQSAYESLRDEILADLRAAGPVDVVLLMLHGAMVAQGYEDCEEDIIRRVRDIIGSDAVIGVELDLHCHLSESKIAAVDIVMTYKEYPHVDINDRARELFEMCLAAKRGEIRPVMSLFDCQMLGIYATSRQPLRGVVDAMLEAERQKKGVLSISFGHGFQCADVPHVGAKVLAVTNGDVALAKKVAREFGIRLYKLRRQIGFETSSLPLEEALSRADASDKTPVVIADQSDNPGGGAPGDATFALRWLLEHQVHSVALAILYDPEVVKIAKKAGEGAALPMRIGGKMGLSSGAPVDVDVQVLASRDNYVHAWPQQSGAPVLFNAGDVVALRCPGEIDIVVSSERCQCFSPAIFSDLGIDPQRKRLLIAKSMQHFHGEFSHIAGEIIYMAAPGAVPPDPRLIAYKRLETHRLYPWCEDPLGQEASGLTSSGEFS